MRKYIFVAAMTMIATLWCSCDDVETYAEMKEKEKAHIEDFISEQGIKVITKAEFEKDTITDVEKTSLYSSRTKACICRLCVVVKAR